MLDVGTLETAIRSVRRCALNDKDYLGVYEFRTKYVLIDPLLRALGWDTGDPRQVQLEFETGTSAKRADYALFKPGVEKPAGLIEAKVLNPKAISQFKEREGRVDASPAAAFERLRSPVVSEPLPKSNLFDAEEWAGLKRAGVEQLEGYVNELQLKAGYAILTNGDDWWIYDLKKYDLGNGVSKFDDSLAGETSVLDDGPRKSAEALARLRRNRKWPGL